MILSNKKDAIHKAWLYRLLIHIVDCHELSELYFKGGTCAAMLGFLDRFSIDLDFDYVGNLSHVDQIRQNLETIFQNLNLEIKDASQKGLQFYLKYPIKNSRDRNTLKIDISFPPPQSNKYRLQKIVDIDRVVKCQEIETMFANKLVAVLDRYEKHGLIAGRDIYDIYYFFLNGYRYHVQVIEERRQMKARDFFIALEKFIDEKINLTIINQDLNMLLPYERFNQIRKTLKTEVLLFIRDEIKILKN